MSGPTLSRRDLVLAGAAAAAGLVLPHARAAQPGAGQPASPPGDKFLEWRSLGEGVDVALGFGGNAAVFRTKDGDVLIDCKNAPFGQVLRRESGDRLKAVINTHHHADHTGGNHAFTGDLPVMAHKNATPRVLAQMNRYISQLKEAATQLEGRTGPAAEAVRKEAKALYLRVEQLKVPQFAPTATFDPTIVHELGGERFTLTHLGPAHTDNDIIVHWPARNVIHTGDLLFHKRHPVIDRDAGATTVGWRQALREIIALCNAKTTVIPGHGDPTDLDGLKTQIAYFDAAEKLVRDALAAGKKRDEIIRLPLAGFESYSAVQGLPRVLTAVLAEVAPPAAPPPPEQTPPPK